MLKLQGLYVAVVTPFRDGHIDEAGFRSNIEFLIENKAAGVVPCGTTGESATMSWEEHMHVVDVAVDVCKGRVQVIAGAGSNNTREAIEAAKHAKKAGADAALTITPYYNKPTPEGQYQHFERIAGEAGIPLVLYNVPSRTGTNLLPSTLERLCEIDNIAAVKEASGDITQICEIHRVCGDRLTVLSGDDAMTLPVLAIGGTGVISVVGNIVPKQMSNMIRLWHEGDLVQARKLHYTLLNLCQAMFYETNPMPVKTAMGLLGLASGNFRLPMVNMLPAKKEQLVIALKEFGLSPKS